MAVRAPTVRWAQPEQREVRRVPRQQVEPVPVLLATARQEPQVQRVRRWVLERELALPERQGRWALALLEQAVPPLTPVRPEVQPARQPIPVRAEAAVRKPAVLKLSKTFEQKSACELLTCRRFRHKKHKRHKGVHKILLCCLCLFVA